MSIGRLGPSKDHFVVAWDATIVEEDMLLGMTRLESSLKFRGGEGVFGRGRV